MPDPVTLVTSLSAIKTTFDALRSAIGLVKETKELLPKGETTATITAALATAESSSRIAEAEVAKALGYELCKCQFPPTPMLTVGYHDHRVTAPALRFLNVPNAASTAPVRSCLNEPASTAPVRSCLNELRLSEKARRHNPACPRPLHPREIHAGSARPPKSWPRNISSVPEGAVPDRGRELARTAIAKHRIHHEAAARADREGDGDR